MLISWVGTENNGDVVANFGVCVSNGICMVSAFNRSGNKENMGTYNIDEQEEAVKKMRKGNNTMLLILLAGCAITIIIYYALGGN